MTKENKQKFPGTNMKREIAGFALPSCGIRPVSADVQPCEYGCAQQGTIRDCSFCVGEHAELLLLCRAIWQTALRTGFGIYLSRCYGKGDAELYRKCFSAAVYLNGILAVISVILAWNAAAVLSVVRVPPELLHDCKIYLSALLLGNWFSGIQKSYGFCKSGKW